MKTRLMLLLIQLYWPGLKPLNLVTELGMLKKKSISDWSTNPMTHLCISIHDFTLMNYFLHSLNSSAQLSKIWHTDDAKRVHWGRRQSFSPEFVLHWSKFANIFVREMLFIELQHLLYQNTSSLGSAFSITTCQSYSGCQQSSKLEETSHRLSNIKFQTHILVQKSSSRHLVTYTISRRLGRITSTIT